MESGLGMAFPASTAKVDNKRHHDHGIYAAPGLTRLRRSPASPRTKSLGCDVAGNGIISPEGGFFGAPDCFLCSCMASGWDGDPFPPSNGSNIAMHGAMVTTIHPMQHKEGRQPVVGSGVSGFTILIWLVA